MLILSLSRDSLSLLSSSHTQPNKVACLVFQVHGDPTASLESGSLQKYKMIKQPNKTSVYPEDH